MMLARVDGKSPVEYLDEAEQQTVRIMAVPLLKRPSSSLPAMTNTLVGRLETAERDWQNG